MGLEASFTAELERKILTLGVVYGTQVKEWWPFSGSSSSSPISLETCMIPKRLNSPCFSIVGGQDYLSCLFSNISFTLFLVRVIR